jgi:hypothetical protein
MNGLAPNIDKQYHRPVSYPRPKGTAVTAVAES